MTRPHLSDRQLRLVQSAAASLPVQRRDIFLKQIADSLRGAPSDSAVVQVINLALDRAHVFGNGI
jgi:hypothetical protein